MAHTGQQIKLTDDLWEDNIRQVQMNLNVEYAIGKKILGWHKHTWGRMSATTF